MFSFTSFENCPGNQPIQVSINLGTVSGFSNKLFYSGSVDVSEVVTGPLELTAFVNRCDFSMKNCEKYPSVKMSSLCQKLQDKGMFFYDIIKNMVPAIECPIQPQIYTSRNSSVDLSVLSFIPMSQSLWLTTIKIFSGKNKTLALCTIANMKIVQVKSARTPKPKRNK